MAPPVKCLVPLSIALVAQGAKQMWAGGEGFPYDTGRFLVDVAGPAGQLGSHPGQPGAALPGPERDIMALRERALVS